jgi:SAM-dependent methyltransferase
MNMKPNKAWSFALSEWAIPKVILEQAPESPWIHPAALFNIPDVIEMTPAHKLARELMPEGGTVLDIGCGGGLAAFATTPPAAIAIGVDHQEDMLEMFSANAKSRGVEVQTFLGFWPAVASEVPVADVVTVHHVVYNVSEIVPFIAALNSHARKRVVIELPAEHPLSAMRAAWKHFWDLDRPTKPTPEDLMAVLLEMGITPEIKYFSAEMRNEKNLEDAAKFMRIRLCLPVDREDEVRDFFAKHGAPATRELAVIYWDI